MKKASIISSLLLLMLLGSCSAEKIENIPTLEAINWKIEKLSESHTEAEKNDNLESFIAFYDENAISMPEYQPMLNGNSEIEAFYQEIFRRQSIKVFQKEIDEIIHLDSTIIEIGTLRKEYTDEDADTLLIQNGKYWNVWTQKPDGSFKLKSEVFGFFHPIEKPERLTVQTPQMPANNTAHCDVREIPLELRAYNALNEKLVRIRDGALRSQFYTEDARFMPFQEPTVTGMEEIKPYLTEYSSRGNVSIDSISVDTYCYQYFDDYVLEYATFWVKWSVAASSGRTEGKGIRLWKRQKDKSIKIYRHIGTHNHLG